MSETRSRNLTALAIFVALTPLLLVFHGNRFVATNDEGIILESAGRMLHGSRLYTDFFGYMSPGSYWLQTLIFRIFGVAMWTGRLIVIADVSLQCALVFWLTARIATRRAAVVAVAMFAGFQIADPNFLTTAHRWDSATFALAGIAVALSSWKRRWVASGALLAMAAWCTPAVAAAGAAVGLFLAVRSRRDLLPFAAGIGGISAAAIALLFATGSFGSFLQQLAWLRTNYSDANVMPYGSIIGGYRALFEGATGAAELAVRSILVACVALPATLPVIGVIAAMAVARQKSSEERGPFELLTLAAIAMVASVFPRADVQHLAFVAALPYVLAVAGLARVLPARASAPLAMAMMLLAGIFGSNFFTTLRGTTPVASPVGVLRVPSDQAAAMTSLFAEVRPQSSLFVFPYLPIQYFVTQTKNPARLSFFSPGMMPESDVAATLAELRRHPPQWLLYMKLSEAEFLRVFPHGKASTWHFEEMEKWFDANYSAVDNPPVSIWGYVLYRRNASCGDGSSDLP